MFGSSPVGQTTCTRQPPTLSSTLETWGTSPATLLPYALTRERLPLVQRAEEVQEASGCQLDRHRGLHLLHAGICFLHVDPHNQDPRPGPLPCVRTQLSTLFTLTKSPVWRALRCRPNPSLDVRTPTNRATSNERPSMNFPTAHHDTSYALTYQPSSRLPCIRPVGNGGPSALHFVE